MRTLNVYLHDGLVGHIFENRKGGRFQYLEEVVERHTGLPVLSLSLPAKVKPFGEGKTFSWFTGLLPEGRRREDICRSLNISPYDWIGLLGAIGWECAGAVKVCQEDGEPIAPASYRVLSPDELGNRLSDISLRLPRETNGQFRMSLGGFQEKLCVAMPPLSDAGFVEGVEASLPEGDAASTHILKPENAKDYSGSAESEAWAMRAARKAARCSKVALLSLPGVPSTLVVERFDRRGAGWPGDVRRLHQEDACQALGIDSSDKYADPRQAKGSDPSYKAMAELLVKHAGNPLAEMQELLRQMTVNFALGNWDAHGKNSAFLYEKPMAPTMAPLYDVVPIAEVEPRTEHLSLRIGGCILPREVGRKQVLEEACGWGLSASVAEETLAVCLKDLEAGIREASEVYPDAGKRHAEPSLRRMDALA